MTENQAVLREAFARWNRRDLDGTLELMAEDVRWYPEAAAPDIEGEYLGRAGLQRFFADFMDPWDRIELEPLEMRTVGDEVVVRVRFRAEGREGVRVDMLQGHRYRFRDGLVAQYNGYETFEEALEA